MEPAYRQDPKPEPEQVEIVHFNQLSIAGRGVALALYPIPVSVFIRVLMGFIRSLKEESTSIIVTVVVSFFGIAILFCVAAGGYGVVNKLAKLGEQHLFNPVRAFVGDFFTLRRAFILFVMIGLSVYWWVGDLRGLFTTVPMREIGREFPTAYPFFLICVGLTLGLAFLATACIDWLCFLGWETLVILISWRVEVVTMIVAVVLGFVIWETWKSAFQPLVAIPVLLWLVLEIGYKLLPDRQAEDLRLAVSAFRFYRS